jgi:hypothetical protein
VSTPGSASHTFGMTFTQAMATCVHDAVEDKESDKALGTLGIVLDVAFGPIAILVRHSRPDIGGLFISDWKCHPRAPRRNAVWIPENFIA